jgi:hypothetical protein
MDVIRYCLKFKCTDVIKYCLKYNCTAMVLKMGPRALRLQPLQESSALAFGRKLAEKELPSARLPASPFPSNMTSILKDPKVIFNNEAVAATKIDKNSWITFEILSGKLSVDSSLSLGGLELKAGDINLYKVPGIVGAASLAYYCNSVDLSKYKKCIAEAMAKQRDAGR